MATVLFLIMLGAHAGADATARTAGDLCPLSLGRTAATATRRPAPGRGPPTRRPAVAALAHHRQLRAAHGGGHRGALPDLRDDRQLAARPGPAGAAAAATLPHRPAVVALRHGLDAGQLSKYMTTSAIMTVIIVVGPAGHLDPGRLRLRLPALPVQAHPLRPLPDHADDPLRGHVHHQPRHRHLAALVQHLRRAVRALPRHGLRHLPAAPGLPADPAATCRRRPRSTATGTGAS